MIRARSIHHWYAVTLAVLLAVVAIAAPSGAASAGQPRAAVGVTFVLVPTRAVKQSDFDLLTEIVQERIDRLGVQNATLSRKGNKLFVHLFGVSDSNIAALREYRISFTAAPELRFRPVLYEFPISHGTTAGAQAAKVPAAVASCDRARVVLLFELGNKIANTGLADDQRDACVVLPEGASPRRMYLGKTQLTGTAIDVVRVRFLNGEWTVDMAFTKPGSKRFDVVGRRDFHGQLAIVVEGVVQSAPAIQPANQAFSSFGGRAEITGNFTKREASNVARLVNHSNAALPFKVTSVRLG